jgi:hypothetical protein
MRSVVTLTLLFLAVALPVTARQIVRQPVRTVDRTGAPVPVSYDTAGVELLNRAIEAATAAGMDWPRDPVQVALHDDSASGTDEERPALTLWWRGDHPEGATSGEVVVVRTGLRDDSTEAVWDRYLLARRPDGSWRVTAHHAASRCARGTAAQTSRFHGGDCP